MEQTSQEGGVTVSGGVQVTCECETKCHDLVGKVVMSRWLNLTISEIFFNLTDSVIQTHDQSEKENTHLGTNLVSLEIVSILKSPPCRLLFYNISSQLSSREDFFPPHISKCFQNFQQKYF